MQWKLFRFFSLQSFLTIQRGGKIFFIIIIIIIKIDPMIRGQSFGILSIRITETGMLTARNVLFTDRFRKWTLFPYREGLRAG